MDIKEWAQNQAVGLDQFANGYRACLQALVAAQEAEQKANEEAKKNDSAAKSK